MLEVYSENDKKKLIQHHPDNSWSVLSSIQPVGSVNADDDDLDFEFGDSETMEYEELIKNATSEPTKHVCIEVEEDVDVDDI